MGSKVVIFAATSHDDLTREISRACALVPSLLKKQNHTVYEFHGNNAKRSSINSTLKKLDQEFTRVYGFFACHGSSHGLYNDQFANDEKVLLNLKSCEEFFNGALICCACLRDATFIESLMKSVNKPSTLVVLGYSPNLGIFPRRTPKRLKADERQALAAMMREHAFILCGEFKLQDALAHLQKQWRSIIKGLPGHDKEFGLTWLENLYALKAWGNGDQEI